MSEANDMDKSRTIDGISLYAKLGSRFNHAGGHLLWNISAWD